MCCLFTLCCFDACCLVSGWIALVFGLGLFLFAFCG